jgi:hypothetical protein
MNTSKTCEMLTNFLLSNNCIPFLNHSSKTKYILKQLYNNISDADKELQQMKSRPNFYNLKLGQITEIDDIPKPNTFTDDALDEMVEHHINTNSYYKLSYFFNLLDNSFLKRDITIHFIIEKSDVDLDLDFEPNITRFNKYVDNILLSLLTLNKHTTNKCSNNLVYFLYFTSLKKRTSSTTDVLGRNHVNTGFTYTCPFNNAEIVIFRKEEWFKVLIHESFHNLNLDFSGMDNQQPCLEKMTALFNINSTIRLYETYTEFWAKILNILIFNYNLLDDKRDYTIFLKYADFLINYERIHCFFQMVKILKFNKLTYQDILSGSDKLKSYKEDSNVFAYYVITLILLNNYPAFLLWCYDNNSHNQLLQFNQTLENKDKLCAFIESNYNIPSLLDGVICSEKLLNKIKPNTKNKTGKYILTNLRLSLCEIE